MTSATTATERVMVSSSPSLFSPSAAASALKEKRQEDLHHQHHLHLHHQRTIIAVVDLLQQPQQAPTMMWQCRLFEASHQNRHDAQDAHAHHCFREVFCGIGILKTLTLI